MNMIPVNSSNLSAVGYDSVSQTLYVSFHHSGTYAYFNVPEHVYKELMSASSHGKYHAAHIKNVYRYQKIS